MFSIHVVHLVLASALILHGAADADVNPCVDDLGTCAWCKSQPLQQTASKTFFANAPACAPAAHTDKTCLAPAHGCEACEDCGEHEYAVSYGHKYCTGFMQNIDEFSEDGQRWVLATCNCLTRALVPSLAERADDAESCEALRVFAHVLQPHALLPALIQQHAPHSSHSPPHVPHTQVRLPPAVLHGARPGEPRALHLQTRPLLLKRAAPNFHSPACCEFHARDLMGQLRCPS